ncbi:MAG: glucose 1-dehydrogenase [Deltaproteobacteria bacterium]|nr:glucose 1-dehydrogenase [Deltaproteobacteria bacterium]
MANTARKVGFITGGGSGIGLGIATALAATGARIALMGRGGEKLARAASALPASAEAFTVAGDVGNEADVERAVAAVVDRFGRLDYGVNAAGTGSVGGVADQPFESWAFVLRTNLDGTMLALKHEAAAMLKLGNGGSIVNVSSIAGVLTHRLMSAYCVSKAGVEMLTRCAADELGEHGIRVNALRPGLVPTDLAAPLASHPLARANYESLMPLGRLGTVEDVAATAAFLLSDAASWITGQVFAVDGGHTLRGGPDVSLTMT